MGRRSSKSYTDDQWGEAGSLIAHVSSQLYGSVLSTAPYYCGLCIPFAHPFLFLFNYLNLPCFCFRNSLLGIHFYFVGEVPRAIR